MECWGAEGGNGCGEKVMYNTGGKGGYVKGHISLGNSTIIYIYVGSRGVNPKINDSGRTYEKAAGGWNGGGAGDYDHADDDSSGGGGGATDVRTVNGNWDNFNSLKSRIMVAGAGGGGGAWKGQLGGHGGGLVGISSNHMINNNFTVTHGSQTSGYKFGIGEDGTWLFSNSNIGGSGGGYYGGCAYKGSKVGTLVDYGGGGGSSFISGHSGCNAINQNSTSTKITHTGSANHYSGKVFSNTVMIAGDASMPSPTGGIETGHSGNGYCKITWHPNI